MHQNFTHTDLMDRYLKGKLSASEQQAFEDKMQQDPLLASEMSLQQEIYNALSETRKSALKHRLNQVPVHQSPWAPWTGLKTAAVVGTLFLVGATYYYMDSSTTLPKGTVELPNRQVSYPKAYVLDRAIESTKTEENLPALPPSPAPEEVAVEEEVPTSLPSPRKRSSATPTIVRPEVVSEFDEEVLSVDYDDFNVPEKQTLQGTSYQEEEVAIETLPDSDYDFHYQFYDNKLYLHGNFRGVPYKIIALNTEADKKLFLEFEGAYYRIGEQREAIPLVAIEDSVLVENLRSLSQAD